MADDIFGPYPDDNCNRHEVYSADRTADLGAEPVTLAEAKTQLRVTFTDDDAEILALITRARKTVETYCNISIVYQRITAVINYGMCWPLPYGPVIGLEAVDSKEGGAGSAPATYTPAESWQQDGDEFYASGKTRLVYTAGHSTCPVALKEVILEVISFLYENRGADTGIAGLREVLANADAWRRVIWI